MPLLHRRKAAQKLKMYALSSGGGSFCRRRFSSSPWPSLAAARSAGRARSRAVGVPPAAPAPLGRLCALPPFGRRRFAPVAAAACSVLPSGKGKLCGLSGRPCPRVRPRCLAAWALCRPAPPSLLGRLLGPLRGVLAVLVVGRRPRRVGGLRAPPCRPFGLRCAFAPSAGPYRAGFARAFLCLRAPPRKGFLSPLRRRRGDAAAAAFLRRLRVCEASLRSSVYSEQLSE